MSVFPTIAEAARQIAAKQISPVELTKTCLDRIAAVDGKLNSFITVTADRAMADAKAAEARIMAGSARGVLDGMMRLPCGHRRARGSSM